MKIKIIGNHDQKAIDQLKNCVEKGAERGILCADGHVGYAQPVGGVVAYKDKVSISGVGYDIACGNMAVKLGVKYADVKDRLPDIGKKIVQNISFGVGRTNTQSVEAACLEDDPAWNHPYIKTLKDIAQTQLGTVGSGNHYVDVFKDTEDFIWIGVHFGSRGLGHRITTHFLEVCGAKEGVMVDPCVIARESEVAQEYLMGMQLAGRYAYAGREWVCQQIATIIQGNAEYLDCVHNHHNYAWTETHDGQELFVVRKGATPAFPGQRGFVGGSMGDISVILEGKDSPEAKENLYSTVHGAGRVMSRTEAAGKMRWKGRRKVPITRGKVNEKKMREEVAKKGTLLFGAGADEAPEVYRPLKDVLDAHKSSIDIKQTLYPLIVCMAGSNEFDPYKD